MLVRTWLTRTHEELPAEDAGAAVGRALQRIEDEFGREGTRFLATITPTPQDVTIEISFETSLEQRRVLARMPLYDGVADVDWDHVEFGWEE